MQKSTRRQPANADRSSQFPPEGRAIFARIIHYSYTKQTGEGRYIRERWHRYCKARLEDLGLDIALTDYAIRSLDGGDEFGLIPPIDPLIAFWRGKLLIHPRTGKPLSMEEMFQVLCGLYDPFLEEIKDSDRSIKTAKNKSTRPTIAELVHLSSLDQLLDALVLISEQLRKLSFDQQRNARMEFYELLRSFVERYGDEFRQSLPTYQNTGDDEEDQDRLRRWNDLLNGRIVPDEGDLVDISETMQQLSGDRTITDQYLIQLLGGRRNDAPCTNHTM